jgi:hypothetical protein
MLEETSNISAYRVITMSDRKALELSLNGISPFQRGEGSTSNLPSYLVSSCQLISILVVNQLPWA